MNLIRNDLLYDGRRGEVISFLLINEIPREEMVYLAQNYLMYLD